MARCLNLILCLWSMKYLGKQHTHKFSNCCFSAMQGWKRHGSYCYFVGAETKTFHEANDDCKSSNSYLADVSTGPEKHFWIGLSNLKNREYFITVISYTNWAEGQPVNGSRLPRRGEISTSDGTWMDIDMWVERPYICKTQKGKIIFNSVFSFSFL
uniref:C-type lectin domain-containing protein n=1 Tax=Neolamprologus brichardi TaxID=32507 RepID=A0A3Q4HBA5_NEOBR